MSQNEANFWTHQRKFVILLQANTNGPRENHRQLQCPNMDTCVGIGLSVCESTTKLGIKCWTWSIQLSELGRLSYERG